MHHQLITEARRDDVEPEAVMAAAALALVSGVPWPFNGRIAYSQQLLAELGLGPAPRPDQLVSAHPRLTIEE
ncbi:MAG: hypothetical protein R2755_07155 [Acidimicrobiales bacterium]